ncbi:MAG: hypothetical protein ACXWL2_03410 [Candidatus Chromulinivorax sp.]
MQKKFLLLALLVCFASAILKCSSEKQPRMKIGQAFIDLLKDESNKGKSIKQLEAEVWKSCRWEDIVEYLGKDISNDTQLPKNIAQMHALFKVQMFIKVCNDQAKKRGIAVQEDYGELFIEYTKLMEKK